MVRSNPTLTALALLAAALPAAVKAETAPSPVPDKAATVIPASFIASTEIEAMIAKAKATIKPDQANLVQPLLQFTSYRASLEYRQAGAGAAIHHNDAEFFYVLKGGGNLIEGGELLDPAPGAGGNTSAKAIVGGASRHVIAGDVFVVPSGTPHQFDRVEGVLVMIAMKMPMPSERPSGAN
jgi:mannose-6-phosphate isomerase-like protein (cupin superfamily)